MKHILSLIIITLLITSCNNQSAEDKAVIKYARDNGYNIKSSDVKNADPAILFCYSYHLWKEDKKDDAVFWYYVAQYRYRFLSSCSLKLKAGSLTESDGKKILVDVGIYTDENIGRLHLIGGMYRIELYEVIQASWGKTINGYAYGDLSQMKMTIDKMLAYQEKNPFNPMGLTPNPILKSEEEQTEKIQKIKDSYMDQKKDIDTEADNIRKTRIENGLENRN